MRVRSVVVLSLVASVAVIGGLTFAYPAVDDLMVENPFWNGLSRVYVLVDPVRVKDLTQLRTLVQDPENSTLLILGPSTSFSGEDLRALRVFVSGGGLLVLADDFGSGNEVLEGFGFEFRFDGALLQDQLLKDKNGLMPKVYSRAGSYLRGVDSLVLNYASVFTAVEGADVLTWSSPFSYVTYEPALPDEAVAGGPFPVVVERGFGEGKIVAVSDSSLFINSMIERGGNMACLLNLVSGEVFIDEGHSMPSRLTLMRAFLVSVYSFLRNAEVRYGLAVVCVLSMFYIKWEDKDGGVPVDEVEELLMDHPEYDRGLLERLREMRRSARGRS